MMLKHWLAYVPLLVSLVAADEALEEWLDGQVKGDDFDFVAEYPSGLILTTNETATERGIVDHSDILEEIPTIQVSGLSEQDRKKKYIAFAVTWYVPYIDSWLIGSAVMGFSWIHTNLSVLDNGTLHYDPDISRSSSGDPDGDGGEVRNGTMHVWEHTQDLDDWLNHDEADGRPMPIWWNIARVWSANTSQVSQNFSRANLDFQ